MLKKKKSVFLLPVLLLIMSLLVAKNFHQAQALSLTDATALLDNSRLSFMSALEGAQTVGSSLITIDVVNYPSESVLQLQNGDTLKIGTANTYTVNTTIDDTNDNKLSLSTGLVSGDTTDDLAVIATQSSTLTVKFTTVSALDGGSFRILVPAVSEAAANRDGIPDVGGFDFGSGTTAAITCPTSFPAGYTGWTDTNSYADSNNDGIDTGYYHVFECAYTGTGYGEGGAGDTSTVFDGTTYSAFTIANLINPAPRSTPPNEDELGEADTYTIIVQHLDDSDTVIDQSLLKIGVIDAVRVSATIAPQLTFKIAGVATSQSKCGITTEAATSALAIPFGELSIGYYTDLAQVLTVTTNAANGYQVTVAENDQLGKDGQACSGDGSGDTSCIVDALMSGLTHTTAADWDTDGDGEVDGTAYGFGYTLGAVTGSPTRAFYYNESSRNYNAKQFADLAATEEPQVIFYNSTATDSDVVDVCYRLAPSSTNVAGDYENYITYTASASF